MSFSLVADGCRPTERPVSTDPPDSSHVDGSELPDRFSLSFVDIGEVAVTTRALRIEPSGCCQAVLLDSETGRTWTQYEFQITDAQFQQLRRVLDEIGFMALGDAIDEDIVDGTTWCFRVTSENIDHAVVASNRFPESIKTLERFIEATFLDAVRNGDLPSEAEPASESAAAAIAAPCWEQN